MMSERRIFELSIPENPDSMDGVALMNHRRTTAVLACWIISFAAALQAQPGDSAISPVPAVRASVPRSFPFAATENVLSLDGTNNRVLDLSGANSYVDLPGQLYTNTLVTVEGWVKWRSFGSYSRWFQFADAGVMLAVMNLMQSDTLRIERYDNAEFDGMQVANLANVLRAGEWQHLAVVVGTEAGNVKLYVNGDLVQLTLTPFDWKPNPLP